MNLGPHFSVWPFAHLCAFYAVGFFLEDLLQLWVSGCGFPHVVEGDGRNAFLDEVAYPYFFVGFLGFY